MTEVDFSARSIQPYLNIGFMRTTWADGTGSLGVCSLVGRNDILTAGHMVFNPDKGGWATGFEFYLGADYNSITGSFDSYLSNVSFSRWKANAWTSQIYEDGNNQTMLRSEVQYDVALIGIDTPIGDQLGWLGLDPGYNGSQTAIAVGYPAGSTGMMTETVSVAKNYAFGIYDSLTPVMGPGSSGGPLMQGNYVIGVNSTTYSWADIGNFFLYDTLIAGLTANDFLLDKVPPVTTMLDPLDDSADISVSRDISISFSESITLGTGLIVLKSANDTAIEVFDPATSSRLTVSGSLLTINPTLDLQYSTFYNLNIAPGAVKDLADNLAGGIFTYNFSTRVGEHLLGAGGADVLLGSIGSDTIDGGLGSDSMTGGLGNDTYYIDTQADLVFEGADEGTDTVLSTVSFYLYANIENLTLASGAGNIFGSANALDNTVTGNESANLLLGWDGHDTLIGNAGDDILYGVEGNDSLQGDAGVDVLVGGNGTDALDGGADPDSLYGEAGNDTMYGGSGFATDILVGGDGNDVLDGSASVASGQTRNQGDYDLMDGGAGDDTFYVDTPADLTFEAAGGGTDTVIADINGGGYYLYAHVENLTLTGNTPFGVGNELDNRLTGSAQGNWLLGGAGNDTIQGMGGYDVLFGQEGADTFVFERGTGGDVVGDFQHGVDKIDLTGLGYSFAQLQTRMVENGGTTAIDLGDGDFVVLVGVATNTLGAGNFVLPPGQG